MLWQGALCFQPRLRHVNGQIAVTSCKNRSRQSGDPIRLIGLGVTWLFTSIHSIDLAYRASAIKGK